MNSQIKLNESETKLASIVWEFEPISSSELVKKCENLYGWKKSTTYTILKRLINKDILQNQNSTVFSCVKKEQIQVYESQRIINKIFNGSLPCFVSAFMKGHVLTEDEVNSLRKLIDSYEEGKNL